MPIKDRLLFVSLILASISCLAILVVRTHLTHNYYYWFLNWNLFLGWLPLLLAWAAARLARPRHPTPATIFFVFLWFIFFPNAPYIITDFLHLKNRLNPYLYFDIITLFSYSTTSLLIGFYSLHTIHQLAKKYFPKILADIFIVANLLLASFGVYLGREVRWNSWEILTHPITLGRDLVGTVVNPFIYTKTATLFTLTLTLFLVSTYLFFHLLTSTDQHNQH